MNTKICTDIEQSKKLLELGLDPKTADMIFHKYVALPSLHALKSGMAIEYDKKYFWLDIRRLDNNITTTPEDILSWSITALLELIPESINDYTDNFSQLEITKKSISYVYADGRLRVGSLKSNLLDAAFEIVCWLLTNKLLTI